MRASNSISPKKTPRVPRLKIRRYLLIYPVTWTINPDLITMVLEEWKNVHPRTSISLVPNWKDTRSPAVLAKSYDGAIVVESFVQGEGNVIDKTGYEVARLMMSAKKPVHLYRKEILPRRVYLRRVVGFSAPNPSGERFVLFKQPL